MDNHATTRVDPRVVEAMIPCFDSVYGNAGSTSHPFGWDAAAFVEQGRKTVAQALGCLDREVVFTSGATESNNLAIRGVVGRPRRKGNHLVSLATEHKAVVDPLVRLSRSDLEVTFLDVEQAGSERAGWIDPQRVAEAIRDDTVLVSVMLANNEIGTIQSLAEIGAICKERGVLLHSDATQALGKIPLDVEQLQVDLLSCSAHKLYGPKGVGALYRRRRNPGVRLAPQIDGGGQEQGFRSGTLNVAGIVGFGKAVELCAAEMSEESTRLATLRDKLFAGLINEIPNVQLNGPGLDRSDWRLSGNLNCSFESVDGEALMMSMGDLAVSSGSACTSANPEPSHVLRAIGLSDEMTRASLRFGLGRFNTADEVEFAIEAVTDAVTRLRMMST